MDTLLHLVSPLVLVLSVLVILLSPVMRIPEAKWDIACYTSTPLDQAMVNSMCLNGPGILYQLDPSLPDVDISEGIEVSINF